MSRQLLQVAVPAPLRRHFDYLATPPFDRVRPGMRVLAPFGRRRQQLGLVLACTDKTRLAHDQLKPIHAVIDDSPLFDERQLALLLWASRYYQHPIGEVIFTALPGLLRQGRPAECRAEPLYVIATERPQGLEALRRAPKQRLVFDSIAASPQGIGRAELAGQHNHVQAALRALLDKQLIRQAPVIGKGSGETSEHCAESTRPEIQLNAAQAAAVRRITDNMDSYQASLLQGVTGSGKTEVYIEAIRAAVKQNRQTLALAPEIGLAPQLLQRLRERLPVTIAVLHSRLSPTARLAAWLAARSGRAQVIIGTRSAIWTPLKRPGLFIIDEEHDVSYKQEHGLRYSARDVAVMRAQMTGVPVVLGSATPSLESLHNVNTGKFRALPLKRRAAGSSAPRITLINLQNQQITGAFSATLLQAIEDNLAAGKQTLLFLNRRGYAPAIFCHCCGWICGCERCAINMTWHRQRKRLICHHCNRQRTIPQQCEACGGARLLAVGHGTQRISRTIGERFPGARILRIDRDSTARRGSMDAMLKQIEFGQADILIGTQMLAKGHHFPNITLVGIVDADGGLLSADFRATERMAQLITQVSGRAGRADKPGAVYIQTHYPQHPLLQALVHKGYARFADSLLAERRRAMLPPYRFLALLRAEAKERQAALGFLQRARGYLDEDQGKLELSGPYLAPLERIQGRYRYQLVIQADKRAVFKAVLGGWLLRLEATAARTVRWSLDIDPQDML